MEQLPWPQAGNGMKYFTVLGNFCGRWSTVDGDWRRSSKSGQRFMRSIPRCYPRSDEHEETRLALLAHTEYWMGQFLDARDLSQKFILTSKSEIDPRLSEHMPMRAMFYRMQHLKRPPPRRTAMTRFYFHGTYHHTELRAARAEMSCHFPPKATRHQLQESTPATGSSTGSAITVGNR